MALPGLGPPPLAPPAPQSGPPYSPALFNLNHTNNMSGNSIAETLILLSGAYLSIVQPAPGPPKVGLHAIFPKTIADFMKEVTNPFGYQRRVNTLRKYRNVESAFDVNSTFSKSEYAPQELLDILCDQIFPRNTITVFYLNNPETLYEYRKPTVEYLPQIISSLGIPIISYDTQFSFNKRPPLSIQLAPTISQMMDVLFVFLKRYNWTDFSFLCTLSKGCMEEIAAIRTKVEQSHRRPVTTIYGVEMFSFNLLSYVNFTNGRDSVEVEEKLRHEMDRDTRVLLVHGDGSEVLEILDVAKKLGLTGRDYVWIFTSACVSLMGEPPRVSRSFPLGSFIIGFDSSRNHMEVVVKNAIDIWLQALDSLAISPDIDDMDFDTGFSCQEHDFPLNGNKNQSRNGMAMKWKHGELLYEHMLKTTIEGDIEFDEYGILKGNQFWIRNIQLADVGSGLGHSTSVGQRHGSNGRTNGRGNLFGRRPSSKSSLGSRKSRPSSNSGRHSSGRDRDGSRNRNRDRLSGRNPHRVGGRRPPSRGGALSRNREGKIPDRSTSRLFADDSQYQAFWDRPPVDAFGSAGTGNGNSPTKNANDIMKAGNNNNIDNHRQRADEIKSENELLLTTAETPEEERFIVSDRSIPTRDTSLEITQSQRTRISNKGANFGAKARVPNTNKDGDGGRSKRELMLPPFPFESYYHRRKRASKGKYQIAKKIANWDGKILTISSITWPGGANNPPKGKPDRYVLRVATWKEDPHVIYVNPDNTTGECDSHSLPCTVHVRGPGNYRVGNATKEVCCTGLAMDLLKRLSEELHIDVDLMEAKEGSYGSPLNSNLTKWSGVMGMLTRNEADLAMAALSITPERSAAVEFSMPFLQTGITIIVAIRAGVISPTAFLEPYDYLSWTVILVFSVHATGTSIFIFEWLSPYGLNHGKTPLSVHKFSLFRSFWLIWAMLFGASVSTDMPRGCASRFLANIWALFAVVFCASYTANLAAFMITKDDFYDLSGITDWRLKNPHFRQPPFKFATIINSSTDTNIRNNYPEIHRFMTDFGQYDVKAAIEALKNQEIQAFIYDSTTLEYEVGKDSGCKLKTVGKRIAETGYGVAFPKKSQWLKKFNVALLRLQEDGEIERIQKFWLAGACHKKKERVGVSSHTLGILNFTSAFILLGGGIILGAILLTLEHCYFRLGRKQLKKWDKYGCCSLVSLSMGQSLTFERSVMEAIDYHRQHKCKDPICETQLWKVKHELDLALLKIAQLRKQIAHSTSGQGVNDNSKLIPSAQAMGGADSPTEKFHSSSTAPRRRRQTRTDGDRQDTTTKSLLGSHSDEEDDGCSNNYNTIADEIQKRPKDVLWQKQPLEQQKQQQQPQLQPQPQSVLKSVPTPHHHLQRQHQHEQPQQQQQQNRHQKTKPPPVVPRQPRKPSSTSKSKHNITPQMTVNGAQPNNNHHYAPGQIIPHEGDKQYPDSIPGSSNNNDKNTSNMYAFPPPPPSDPETGTSSLFNPAIVAPSPPGYDEIANLNPDDVRATSPSPPLPPPPTPPPLLEDIESGYAEDSHALLSPDQASSSLNERVTTPAPTSDASMYEPVVLDNRNNLPPTMPSPSPSSSSSSSSSHADNNVPQSPGGMSELSNEGMSLPSSPDRLSNSSDLFGNGNNKSLPRSSGGVKPGTSLSPATQGISPNPFLQESDVYSNQPLDSNNSSSKHPSSSSQPPNMSENDSVKGNNGDVSMTSLKEADNDVDPRRNIARDDGNVYVNVDEIGGKETTF